MIKILYLYFSLNLILLFFVSSGFEITHANTTPSRIIGKDLVNKREVSVTVRDSARGTVIVFLSAKCPCSASHELKLAELFTQFSSKGFQFIGIHSNSDESFDLSSRHFAEAHLPFPVIEDERSHIANSLGALKTPHVFVVNPDGKVLFQGGVDDSHIAQSAQKQYLKEALSAIFQGKAPSKQEVRTLGCIIKRS